MAAKTKTVKGKLIDQRGISEEYGLKTADVIRWCMSARVGFPKPVRIVGRTYFFDRAAIARYFSGSVDGRESS